MDKENTNKLKKEIFTSGVKASLWFIVTMLAICIINYVINVSINTNYEGFSTSTFCECGANLWGDEKYCPGCGESTANVVLRSRNYCANCNEYYMANYQNCKKCGEELLNKEVTKSVKELGYDNLSDLNNAMIIFSITESFTIVCMIFCLFGVLFLVIEMFITPKFVLRILNKEENKEKEEESK